MILTVTLNPALDVTYLVESPSSWPDLLRRATGPAMASVLSPAAGMADPGEASDFAGNVRIQVI